MKDISTIVLQALLMAVPAEYRERTTKAISALIPKLVNTTLFAMASGERNTFVIHDYTYRTSDYEVPIVFAEIAKAATVYADSNASGRANPIWKFETSMVHGDVENPPSFNDADLYDPYEYAVAVNNLTTRSYKLATTKMENGAVTLADLGGICARDGSGFVYLTGSTVDAHVAAILGISDVIDSKYRDVSKSMTQEEIIRWMSAKLTAQSSET